MTVLQVDHVSFGYGADVLFEDVSFTLALGQRLALVAPNGQGKSTLLKLLAGQLTPDEGRVLIPKDIRVGYLHQSHEPDPNSSVLQVLMAPFSEAKAAHEALAKAEAAAASGDEAALDALAHAQERYHSMGADTVERDVTMLAQHMGFHTKDLDRRVQSLSGGERGRLQLAAILASKSDLLLLDEPTNHLDLATVEWLEAHLRAYKGAVIVVSHDRVFLDKVCPHTAELGLLQFRYYHVPYTRYLEARKIDLERERAAVLEQREMIAKTEEFIRRNIAGQKTKQAKSRRTMLEKLVRLENPEDLWADAAKLGLRFSPARRTGDVVLETKGVRSVRGGRLLYEGLDLRLKRLERLVIVGPNGSGKSTLLKLLSGQRSSEDQGEVKLGANVELGYFDQHLEALNPAHSSVDTVRSVRPEFVVDAARQYLSRFRFFGDDAFRAVGSLSGGERTRLALAKLLLIPRNVLFLDEPTNHLDIPACEILEEALRNFDGTVVVVSHDRFFLERVATRVLHLEDGKVVQYPAGYAEYEERRQRGSAGGSSSKGYQSERSGTTSSAGEDKASRKASYEAAKKEAREAERRQRRIQELERSMAEGEKALKTLRAELAEAPGEAWERVVKLAEKEQELVKQIDGWTEEWMRLSEEG